jgi:hypothetical protein
MNMIRRSVIAVTTGVFAHDHHHHTPYRHRHIFRRSPVYLRAQPWFWEVFKLKPDMRSSPDSQSEKLLKDERFLCEAADIAYFKAGRTSHPQDWLEAGLLARQHRNALAKVYPAPAQGAVPCGAKAYVEMAIASYAGDPADNQFQKGFLAALKVVRDEAFPCSVTSTDRGGK